MRIWTFKLVLACVAAMVAAGATTAARPAEPAAWTTHDDAALRELLEGTRGQRQTWETAPELVILESVMHFDGPDMTRAAAATAEALSPAETARLEADLTRALQELTGGRFAGFSGVRVHALPAGQRATLFQRGRIVVGRFEGVHEQAGTLGYGGRTTRGGAITAGAVMLDRDFDRDSSRRHVLRMHELGHALGYNHVESRPSLMNPRVGSELTTFDRTAIEMAHGPTHLPVLVVGPR